MYSRHTWQVAALYVQYIAGGSTMYSAADCSFIHDLGDHSGTGVNRGWQ